MASIGGEYTPPPQRNSKPTPPQKQDPVIDKTKSAVAKPLAEKQAQPASKSLASEAPVISKLAQPARREITNEEYFLDQFDKDTAEFEHGHWEHDFQAEAAKLETYLETQNKLEHQHDLVYVCVGAGHEIAQLFPGFIQKAVPQKKVLSLVFEWGLKLRGIGIFDDLGNPQDSYWRENFSAKQFLCGLPEPGMKTAEAPDYDDGQGTTSCWRNNQMLNHTVKLFENYLEKQLKDGKQVVLSHHIDLLKENFFIVQLYNSLLAKYPDQLHFFMAYDHLNKITNQPITQEACADISKEAKGIWKYHANLQDCTEPLNTLLQK